MTVNVEVLEPAAIDDGLNEQPTPVGRPVQDSATLPVNPFNATIEIVEDVELPAVTGVGENAESTIRKSGCACTALVD